MKNFEKFRILPEKKWLNMGGNFGGHVLCPSHLQLLDNFDNHSYCCLLNMRNTLICNHFHKKGNDSNYQQTRNDKLYQNIATFLRESLCSCSLWLSPFFFERNRILFLFFVSRLSHFGFLFVSYKLASIIYKTQRLKVKGYIGKARPFPTLPNG